MKMIASDLIAVMFCTMIVFSLFSFSFGNTEFPLSLIACSRLIKNNESIKKAIPGSIKTKILILSLALKTVHEH